MTLPQLRNPYDEPMLIRRSSIPTVGQTTKHIFRSRRLRRKKHTLVDPAVPLAQIDEEPTAPSESKGHSDQDILDTVLPPKLPAYLEFPEYDGMSDYSVAEEAAKTLWKSEIKRLLEHGVKTDRPLRFEHDTFLKGISKTGHDLMSDLSTQLLSVATLCQLDNECITLEYCSPLSSQTNIPKLMRQASISQQNDHSDEDGDAQQHLHEYESRLEASFRLIDYVSAVLARLISTTATGRYWQHNLIGVIAKRAAKMKILLLDLKTHAPIIIGKANAAYERKSSLEDQGETDENFLRNLNNNARDDLTSRDDFALIMHCAHQAKFRVGIDKAFRNTLLSLRSLDLSGRPATSYEMCAVVYETGFEGFKSLLFQDRDFEFSATSNLDNLNTVHSAFKNLNQTVEYLRDRISAPPGANNQERLKITIEWVYKDAGQVDASRATELSGSDQFDLSSHARETIDLKSMADIVTVMILLTTCSPAVVDLITETKGLMALTSDANDVVDPLPTRQFVAFFCMTTDEFYSRPQTTTLSLSQAMKAGVFSRYSLMTRSNRDKNDDTDACKLAAEYSRATTRKMRSWVVDENSVTVVCQRYVWTVMTAAFALAGGGLAIAFSVGDRIHSVDPSNMATYAWALAAFLMVICKNLLVANWPWNDFLHSRVRCRSVLELAAVTDINEQLIMARLLNDEAGGSLLKTRGPYNSVFNNQSSDGFSIDCPLSNNTLLLSGLTLLMVATPQGRALVCLDGRRGTDLVAVEHRGTRNSNLLVCDDFNKLANKATDARLMVKGDGEELETLHLRRTDSVEWNRIQGIYNGEHAVFV
ncbi:uncharacterized protein BKCO1_10000162 [Diplodia corticola]|uniref:Uncharacterized protein n=1 Tax=Diplodia corticola TaxID=236234 RepID=A0A1J9R809_9PEZI|nr:uncharacterized protein BKCO1_10000162 [Diplodia corticola]OJD36657.1 hypothetical protein BKCO1_10000162 [Diplodia corticola]